MASEIFALVSGVFAMPMWAADILALDSDEYFLPRPPFAILARCSGVLVLPRLAVAIFCRHSGLFIASRIFAATSGFAHFSRILEDALARASSDCFTPSGEPAVGQVLNA